MSDYFDRVEFELRASALRAAPAPARARRRVRIPGLGGIASGIAAAAAVAVAALAIVALGHHQRSTAPTPASAAAKSKPVCFPVHGPGCLVAQYGVLRRPPVGARPALPGRVVSSMWFADEAARQAHVHLLARFNRAVRIGPTKTILFVAKSSLGPPNYYLGAFLVVGGKAGFLNPDWPFLPQPPKRGHKSANWLLTWSYSRWIRGYVVTVVPDGVAAVRWKFHAYHGVPAHSVYTRVHDNVAVAAVPDRHNSPVLTEYGPTGRVLAVQYQLPSGLHAERPRTLLLRRPLPLPPHHAVGQRNG